MIRYITLLLLLPAIACGQIKFDHQRGVLKFPTSSGPTANGELGFDGTHFKLYQGGSSSNVGVGSGGSATIGSLAYGVTAPDSTYKRCNGQILSQASYPDGYTQVGNLPLFNSTPRSITTGSIFAAAYSPTLGLYTACHNSGVIYVSTDAENWSAVATVNVPSPQSADMVWFPGGGVFVAALSSNTSSVWISADGYSWKLVNAGADAKINVVAASSTLLVGAGNSDTDNSIQYVFTSSDGVTWTKRSTPFSNKQFTAAFYSTTASLFILGCTDGSIVTSPDGITWTSRTSNITTQISQFAESGSLVVAVGTTGRIASSPDGITWTNRTTHTVTLNGVAYLSGATYPWVAGGVGMLEVSTNGTTWTALSSTLSTQGCIFYSGTDSKYVEAGSNGLVAQSTDLTVWTADVAASPTVVWSAGAYGNSAYVIAGASGTIHSSADGTTWTARTSNAGSNTLNHVLYEGDLISLFVAVGASGTLVTSPDGTTWTSRTSNAGSNSLNAIAAKTNTGVSDTLVAVGAAGQIISSTNGTAWTSRTSNTTNQLNGVACNGTTFVAVGNNGTVVTSTDGTTWTKQPAYAMAQANGNNLTWITSDGSNFYALLSVTNPVVFISSDEGVTWTPYSCIGNLKSLNWMNGKLVGYSANGDIFTSTDGKSWTLAPNSRGVPAQYNKLYSFNSAFYLTELSGGGFIKSTDGSTYRGWVSSATNSLLVGVTYTTTNTKCIAVGSNSTIITSTTQGVTWTGNYSVQSSTGPQLTSIAHSPELDLLVAVGAGCQIVTSADNGVTWVQRAFTHSRLGSVDGSPSLLSVIWCSAKGLFVACGSFGMLATSPDGVTWTERDSGTGEILNQVCYNVALGKFLIVGTRFVLSSTNGTSWSRVATCQTNSGTSGVCSLEANGFYVVGGNAFMHSPDGATWEIQGQPTELTTTVKLFYDTINGLAFVTSVSAQSGVTLVTADGVTFTKVGTVNGTGANTPANLTYDSVNDCYVGTMQGNIGATGPTAVTLRRTYNKSTQFALPVLNNTWIKVE